MCADVFIICTVRNPDAAASLQQAIDLAGLHPAQVQDVVFGLDGSSSQPHLDPIMQAAGLACPAARAIPGLRAVFFAAASILSDDVGISVALGLEANTALAFVLASPDAVGRFNLFPRARLAARALAGEEAALRQAELLSTDILIRKEGEPGVLLLHDLLNELEAQSARWGMLSSDSLVLVVEQL